MFLLRALSTVRFFGLFFFFFFKKGKNTGNFLNCFCLEMPHKAEVAMLVGCNHAQEYVRSNQSSE